MRWRLFWLLAPLAGLIVLIHVAIPRSFADRWHVWMIVISGGTFALMTAVVFRAVSRTLTRATERAETARRAAFDRVRGTEEKYRQLFETVSDAILIFDPQTRRFVDANQAARALYGYTKEEFAGMEQTTISAEPEASCAAMGEVLAGRLTRIPLRMHRKKDGTVFPVEISASRALWNGREMICAVNRDVSARMQLAEQLNQARKMEAVGQLAGGIAHDFRNQLTVIRGFAQMILRHGWVAPKGIDKVNEILAAVDRSALRTTQLLSFGRRQVLHPRREELGQLVRGIAQAMERMLGGGVSLSIESGGGDCFALIDPEPFREALFNMVSNANDAMPEGGRLAIEVSRRAVDETFRARHGDPRADSCVCVSLADTGAGMDKAVLAKIFEPFFTTKPAGAGTGLGLAMVYGFVAQSDGFIEVDSAPGAGTTFRLYFPASA